MVLGLKNAAERLAFAKKLATRMSRMSRGDRDSRDIRDSRDSRDSQGDVRLGTASAQERCAPQCTDFG